MREWKQDVLARAGFIAGVAGLSLTLQYIPARAQDNNTYVMKITLPTLNDTIHQVAKNYAAALEKDSAGRIKVQIYPASQLGSIPRQIEGVQFGAIQCAMIPPEFFVGVDERFQLMAAPGLVSSMQHGQRVANDPAVLKLMLALGANKGLHGAGLFMATPSSIIAKTPIRHLADFKGKKIRIFASQFQRVAMERLGAVPKPMTLGDVLPALQDNALDGAVSALTVLSPMQFQRAAKYATEIDQPAIFGIAELSKKWRDALPADLQQIVDKDAAAAAASLNPRVIDFNAKARKAWTDAGGQLISLPADEQSAMLQTLASVGADVSKTKPLLAAAYKIITAAAK